MESEYGTRRRLDVARATQGLERLSIRASNYHVSEILCDPCLAGLKDLRILCPESSKDPFRGGYILARHLESLTLWLYESDDVLSAAGTSPSASPTLIAALFAASSTSLQTLHLKIYDQKSELPIIPVFHLVAPHLRTLILESTHDVLEGHLDLLSACTSLDHLVLRWDDFEYDFDDRDVHSTGPLHMQAILEALSPTPTLRHLSLDVRNPLNLFPIVFVLEHATFNLQKLLEFPRMDLVDGADADWPRLNPGELEAVGQALLSLTNICERRGIEFKCNGKYWVWEKED